MPYLKLLPPGFSCVTTITLAFLSNGHEVRYVPIEYAKRAGRSKFHFFSDAYRYVLQVLRMVMYFNPLKVLMPPALFLLGLGAAKAVYDLVVHPLHFANDTILIFVTGMILASLALLADLIVRSRGDVAAVRIALVGPAHPYKGGGARHTTELAHRLAAAGHDVIIESWRAQYPRRLYPGQQTVDVPEGEPYPRTQRRLAWYRPDGWLADGRPAADRRPGRLRPAHPAPGARLPRHLEHPAPHENRRHLPQRPAARTPPRRRPAGQGAAQPGRPGDHPLRRPGRPGERPGPGRDGADRNHAPAPARLRPARSKSGPERAASPAPRTRLLFFGIVRPYKGLDVLLRALAQAPPHVTLTVAGEFWSGITEMEYLVSELGLRDRVTLRPGYVPADQIPALFADADALVMPYREATASQNALLAFAHGVPVITTTAGALAEAVRDGVDGLTCAPGDTGDLLRALTEISDPEVARRLRAGVPAVDPGPGWAAYLRVLLAP